MENMKNIFIVLLIVGFSISSGVLNGEEAKRLSSLRDKVNAAYPEAVKVWKYLHQHPEPCFKESKTAKYVADYLKKCGLEVHTGIGGTGLKAILKGSKEGPVVGIRADMDALPIEEKTGLPFASKNKGFMHACGHDAHMTNVIIAARVLSQMKDDIPGTIVFIFQPCEEGSLDGKPSGAQQMIADGVLENPKIDAMFGLHVMPGKVGLAALREGPLMANSAYVRITIKGKAGHGAFPNTAIDAVYAASLAVVQFQGIMGRDKDPTERAVLSIGTINGGVRANVIADKVVMEGTIRTFSKKTQDLIETKMDNILKGLQISRGITYDFLYKRGYGAVMNDRKLTRRVIPLFKKILGQQGVEIIGPITGSEDFSFYSHKVPSVFFFLGVGGKNVHTPFFYVKEESLKYGPLLLSAAALDFLHCRN